MPSLAWLPLALSAPAVAGGDSGAAGYHYSWFQELPFVHMIEEAGWGASHDDAIRVVTLWGVCLFLLALAGVARLPTANTEEYRDPVPKARIKGMPQGDDAEDNAIG